MMTDDELGVAKKMNKERFYFNGIFYDTNDEFVKALKQFSNSAISPVSAERILNEMCKDILLNVLNILNMTNMENKICNSQLQEICATFSTEFIISVRSIGEKKKDEQTGDV